MIDENLQNPIERPAVEASNEKITIKLDRQAVMSVILIVLLAFSIAQAIQLRNLQKYLASGVLSAPAAPAAGNQSGGSNLPNMVGGC